MELSAPNVFISIKGDQIEFAFTGVETPTSESDIMLAVLVPAVKVGRLGLELNQLIQDKPEFMGFTKK